MALKVQFICDSCNKVKELPFEGWYTTFGNMLDAAKAAGLRVKFCPAQHRVTEVLCSGCPCVLGKASP